MSNGSLSIVVAGDLVPSRRLFPNGQPSSPEFGEAAGLIRKADIAFGDLEIPLTNNGYPREKGITFRAAPEIAGDLKAVGFHVLSLANNHSQDYGYEGMRDTIMGLTAQGIRTVGAGETLGDAVAPVILEAKGRRIGFIAFSALLPSGSAASPFRPGMAPLHVCTAYEANPFMEMEEPGNPPVVHTWVEPKDLKLAEECVAKLRKAVDFVAVSVHTGYGAGASLAQYEQPLAHALIDAGADVILGNHVHAIHGIEVYNGKAIFYSPGNCIAQQPREDVTPEILAVYDEMSKDGYLTGLEVAEDGTYGVRIYPYVTNADGLPEVQHGPGRRRIAEYLRELSARLNTEIQIEGDEITVLMK